MEARYQLRQSPSWNPEILAQPPRGTEISSRAGHPRDGRPVVGCLGDLGQRLGDPVGHLLRALTGRRSAYVLAPPDALGEVGVLPPDLVAEQALPGPHVDLAQSLVGLDLQTGDRRQRLSGLVGPRQVAGEDR